MNTYDTLFQAVLARMSLGAVPMDGIYWFDPKRAGKLAAATSKSSTQCAAALVAQTGERKL
jgi:hypothetical protein